MRTAQNQAVTASRQQRMHIACEQFAGCRACQLTGLDALNQPGAGLGIYLHFFRVALKKRCKPGAAQGAGSGQNTDFPTLRLLRRRLYCRLHANHNQPGPALAQSLDCCSRCSIASDYQSLDSTIEQKLTDQDTALDNLRGGFFAIGYVGTVGHVNQRLLWQSQVYL